MEIVETVVGLPREHDVPWHRVVRATGEIAMRVGSDAFREQKKRLQKETLSDPALHIADLPSETGTMVSGRGELHLSRP